MFLVKNLISISRFVIVGMSKDFDIYSGIFFIAHENVLELYKMKNKIISLFIYSASDKWAQAINEFFKKEINAI